MIYMPCHDHEPGPVGRRRHGGIYNSPSGMDPTANPFPMLEQRDSVGGWYLQHDGIVHFTTTGHCDLGITVCAAVKHERIA